MTISSRTPEGLPHRCPVCGNPSVTELSFPGGDSCCPSCGHLLWWFRDRLASDLGIAPDQITLTSSFADDLRVNSLDTVELVMALEEEFKLSIPDEDAEKMRTVADVIRFVERRQREGREPDPSD